MLRYDYPTTRVLGKDAPDEMWEELSKKFGLEYIFGIDIDF